MACPLGAHTRIHHTRVRTARSICSHSCCAGYLRAFSLAASPLSLPPLLNWAQQIGEEREAAAAARQRGGGRLSGSGLGAAAASTPSSPSWLPHPLWTLARETFLGDVSATKARLQALRASLLYRPFRLITRGEDGRERCLGGRALSGRLRRHLWRKEVAEVRRHLGGQRGVSSSRHAGPFLLLQYLL